MTQKGLGLLASEMESGGLWRYWSYSDERHGLLPPDLDDTSCTSFILRESGRPLPENRELILANRNAEGIFYTWLLPRASSPPTFRSALNEILDAGLVAVTSLGGFAEHIDCAVNANILLYLGACPETQPAIDYVIRAARQHPPACSDYYIHWLSFYYFLSRAYWNGVTALGQTRATVQARIIAAQDEDGSCGDELLTALAVCALFNFGIPLPVQDRAIEYLLQTQRQDGSWRRVPMFLGPAPYYGSEELTTALCLEALTRYTEQREKAII